MNHRPLDLGPYIKTRGVESDHFHATPTPTPTPGFRSRLRLRLRGKIYEKLVIDKPKSDKQLIFGDISLNTSIQSLTHSYNTSIQLLHRVVWLRIIALFVGQPQIALKNIKICLER